MYGLRSLQSLMHSEDGALMCTSDQAEPADLSRALSAMSCGGVEDLWVLSTALSCCFLAGCAQTDSLGRLRRGLRFALLAMIFSPCNSDEPPKCGRT